MNNFGMDYGMGMPIMGAGFGLEILVLAAWSIFWKGLALWRASKRGEKIWFVAILLINTAGILEIVYLFFIAGAKLSDFTISESKPTEPKL